METSSHHFFLSLNLSLFPRPLSTSFSWLSNYETVSETSPAHRSSWKGGNKPDIPKIHTSQLSLRRMSRTYSCLGVILARVDADGEAARASRGRWWELYGRFGLVSKIGVCILELIWISGWEGGAVLWRASCLVVWWDSEYWRWRSKAAMKSCSFAQYGNFWSYGFIRKLVSSA